MMEALELFFEGYDKEKITEAEFGKRVEHYETMIFSGMDNVKDLEADQMSSRE